MHGVIYCQPNDEWIEVKNEREREEEEEKKYCGQLIVMSFILLSVYSIRL